jgi:hypothetical protein
MLATFRPMLINSSLNKNYLGFVDSSFSDDQGQHVCSIAKKCTGRQQKMKKCEKNKAGEILIENWVEMKNRGLKIAMILARSGY